MKNKCKRCNGTGEIDYMDGIALCSETCDSCKGLGFITKGTPDICVCAHCGEILKNKPTICNNYFIHTCEQCKGVSRIALEKTIMYFSSSKESEG